MEEEYKLLPLIVNIDILHLEASFDIHCPICGQAWDIGSSGDYCDHVVLDFFEENPYLAENIKEQIKAEEEWKMLEEILDIGCKDKLMIYVLSSDGGFSNVKHYYGFSLENWVEMGAWIE